MLCPEKLSEIASPASLPVNARPETAVAKAVVADVAVTTPVVVFERVTISASVIPVSEAVIFKYS